MEEEQKEERKIKLKNWRNLFTFENWKKEIIWIIIILLLVYTYWGYKKDMEICLYIAKNPCEYCFAKQEREKQLQGGMNITFDIPKFKGVNNLLNAT